MDFTTQDNAEAPVEADGLHQDVASFKKGDHIEGVYLLSKLDLRKTKYGDSFFAFEISDCTGSLPARQWEADAEQFGALSDAPVAYVKGTIDEWMNEIQLKVEEVEPVEASMEELRFLLPKTPYDVEQLFEELVATFESLDSEPLRLMFREVFKDKNFVSKLKETPAASSYHHNYLGGLLEHIVSLLRVSEQMCFSYPRLNRDLVLVGAFLHDIGKVEELSWERGFSYTTRGQLLGHIAIGTLMVEEWTRKVEDFPSDLKDELIHLVLAHHGLREHGSPVLPVTPEALVVHFLDNLDGKLWSCYQSIDDLKSGDESWSPYSRHMRRKIFRRGRAQTPSDETPRLDVVRPGKNHAQGPVLEPGPVDLRPKPRLSAEGNGVHGPDDRRRATPARYGDKTPPLFG